MKKKKRENFNVNLDFKNEALCSFSSVPHGSMNFGL